MVADTLRLVVARALGFAWPFALATMAPTGPRCREAVGPDSLGVCPLGV